MGHTYRTGAGDRVGPSFKTAANDTGSHKAVAGDTLGPTYKSGAVTHWVPLTRTVLVIQWIPLTVVLISP
jgi:hypothetical protein